MKKVVIHVGAHKTGTSSIQEAMAGYDDGQTVYARFAPTNHSIPITTIFSAARYDYHIWRSQGLSRDEIDRLGAEYRSVLDAHVADASRDTLIMSGEDIGILADDDKRTLCEYFLSRGLALCEYFLSRGLALHILCFMRDPRALTASAVQQHVKNGMATLTPLSPGYRSRLEGFMQFVPHANLIVRDYGAALTQHGDIVRAFAEACGIAAPPLPPVRHNESLSQSATKLILRFNQLRISTVGTPDRVRARNRLIEFLSSIYPVAGPETRIDPRTTEGLAQVTLDDLVFLDRHFGIVYPPIGRAADAEACTAFYKNLSDVDLAPLRSGLVQRGMDVPPRAPLNSMLIDAYYDGLYGARLSDADVPFLRDLAVLIASGKRASLQDAIGLMQLARRARPNGPTINALIDSWQRQASASPVSLSLAQADIPE